MTGKTKEQKMRLITRNGQLDLPKDFSLTMERNNPLLSGEGDASVPASLPSSKNNLDVLGHRERIDRAEKYINKVDAILEVGPVRKRGQLVMDTVHRTVGIDSSFAIDNSDLYAKAKKKTLKEIFEEYIVKFTDERAVVTQMQAVYEGAPADYKVFPAAVAPWEEDDGHGNKTTHYQYNNGVDANNQLIYDLRTVHEGDVDDMEVPVLYGLAPFLRLSRMVELLFSLIDTNHPYQVVSNCLNDWPFDRIVIVHNCSDCFCNIIKGNKIGLFYKDLVPSCTLGDFLSWLNNKFHVQAVVDSETRHVKIVSMETMLSLSADMDISDLVDGDFTVQLNATKRIVLTPTNKIEGTEPAAATFDKLIEKYGGFEWVNEPQWRQYPAANPTVTASLILRRATGQFYAVEYDPNISKYVIKLLGTNHFEYNRENSDDTEEFSQGDSMPLMLCSPERPDQTLDVAPYIGERLHGHTSYNGSTADETQDIIVVQAVTDSNFQYTTTGTTQPCIPYNQPQNGNYFYELAFGLCTYDLYNECWKRYNTLLLNHPTHLKGRVAYNIGQILAMDMTRLKHCKGQNLLPVSTSSTIGPKPELTDAEFLLVKTFIDGVSDAPISHVTHDKLKWEITNDLDEVLQDLWTSMGGGPNFADIDFVPQTQGLLSHFWRYVEVSPPDVQYTGDYIDPGTPQNLGDVVPVTRQAIIKIHYNDIKEWAEEYYSEIYESYPDERRFENVTVTFTFTAVPA